MNIVFDSLQVDIKNIGFSETKKNIIIDGNFTKIIYSDVYVTLNGIYIIAPILYNPIDKILNKNIISFNMNHPNNANFLKKLYNLETKIVDYYSYEYSVTGKKNIYCLHNQLMSGKIKLYKELNNNNVNSNGDFNIVLKISGIWETENEIGITYKFLEMHKL